MLHSWLTRLVVKVGSKLTDERYIWELRHPERLPSPNPEHAVILCHQSAAELSSDVTDGISAMLGTAHAETMRERFDQGGRVYILVIGQQVGSLAWVKSGRDIRRWMHPINPEDIVTFSHYTNKSLRGRRLAGHCMAAIYAREIRSGQRCFADCNVYNYPSIRQLTRTGFEIIARANPPA